MTGDMFVNLIVTFPALAVSELFENFNWPRVRGERTRTAAGRRRGGGGGGR
jgi:hypothetical protein